MDRDDLLPVEDAVSLLAEDHEVLTREQMNDDDEETGPLHRIAQYYPQDEGVEFVADAIVGIIALMALATVGLVILFISEYPEDTLIFTSIVVGTIVLVHMLAAIGRLIMNIYTEWTDG